MLLSDFRIRNFAWLLVAAIILWGLYSLSTVLTPFFLAAILAYICQPVVAWLHRRRVPLIVAVIGVMFLEALLLALLILTVLPPHLSEMAAKEAYPATCLSFQSRFPKPEWPARWRKLELCPIPRRNNH